MDKKTKQDIIRFQKDEISSFELYKRLAKIEKDPSNKKILEQISLEELRHYEILQKYSNESPKVQKIKVWLYILYSRLFGITFSLKLMEASEKKASNNYRRFESIPELIAIAEEEEAHEQQLIAMINEERLNYMGSVVLGLNDALVEFTGALAGYTLALNDPKLIALTGSITGIAAALSMGSSEYMSTKSELKSSNPTEGKHPVKAAVYTTVSYLITVAVLIAPFVFMKNAVAALVVMLAMALFVIALFNFYYSVVRSESFKKRFLGMAILSFSVAGVSFLIGYLLRLFIGIDV